MDIKKLQLPTVTLLIADCLNSNRAVKVLEKCIEKADFGAIKLLTSIPVGYPYRVKIKPLNTLIAYSIFILKKVHEYVDTKHMLIVQRDGWILNPGSWNPDWLDYDYIAPLFVQYDHVGSGGFSLRSKKMMQEMSESLPEWDGTQKGADEIQAGLQYYEDGVISLTDFGKNYNIAPPEQAALFAQGGNPNPLYYREKPFGFHGVHQNIDHATGEVYPVCRHDNNPQCGCTIDHVNLLQQNET